MNFSPLKIAQLGAAIKNTSLRYPFIILLMAFATFLALFNLWIINEHGNDQSFEGFRWAFILASGLPLYVGYFIWYENQTFSKRIYNAALLALTIGIHFYIGQHIYSLDIESSSNHEPYWIMSWLIIIHLYPSILPFFQSRKLKGFWNFNHWMFSNFIASSFYILLIYAGIALALGGIQLLLFEDLCWKAYLTFLFLLIGIFHPIFFLSSAPSDDEEELGSTNLLALQRIQQWILSPLVVIYLSILYVYMGKIIVQQTLPKGWVSIWILLFSIIGLLNWLLARPFVSENASKWSMTSRRFFLYLFPLIGLLWYAILYRLLEYGLTETRAIVVFIAVFLTAVSLIFFWKPKTHIIAIPSILLIIAFIYINGGPLSASQLSYHSQMRHWNLIKSNPSQYTYDQAVNVLRYLSDYHPNQVSSFCLDCDTISNLEVNEYNWASQQIENTDWELKQDTSVFFENEYTDLIIESAGPLKITGYSEMVSISRNSNWDLQNFSNGYSARIIAHVVSNPENQNETLQIVMQDPSGNQESFFFGNQLKTMVDDWKENKNNQDRNIEGQITFDFNFQGRSFRFLSTYISYEIDSNRIYGINGELLMK